MDEKILKIITKYLENTATEEENARLLEWLEESEDNRVFFINVISNMSLHETRNDPDSARKAEKALARIDARIDEEEKTIAKNKKRSYSWVWAFAAAASVVIAIVIGGISPKETPVNYETYVNTGSFVKSLTLDDNTLVCLKPGASIKYNVAGLQDRRIVEFSGEAYFDVAKDSLRPFTVKTMNISVNVLGTAFSVKSLSRDSNTEVILERGSVQLMSPEGAKLVTLSPDQKAVYAPANGDLHIESVMALALVSSKYNIVTLKNADIAMIVSSVEKNYGVRLVLSGNNVKDRRFNVSYLKSDPIDDVINVIEYLTGVKCSAVSE